MSQKRKKEESSQVSQQSEEPHNEGPVDHRMRDKFGASVRKLFKIRNIKMTDFSRLSHKCDLKVRSINSRLIPQTPENGGRFSTPQKYPSSHVTSHKMSPTTSMASLRGKPLFVHMNKIEVYPKNEIIVGKAYLFVGEHGSSMSFYGFLHDIITECRVISEDLEVVDMYFRVKKLEQVKFKEYEARMIEEEEEEELKTPPRSPLQSSVSNDGSEHFDETGNLIVVLKNTENMIDLSFKEITQADDTVKVLRVHHSQEAMQKYVKKQKKALMVEQHCILLGPSKKDIQQAVEEVLNRVISKIEMDAGRQTVKNAMAHQSLDLIDFAAKVWAEGGYRSKKKNKRQTRSQNKGMEVDGMKIKEIELEFDQSNDDEESKEDTWSKGEDSLNEAQMEDDKPVEEYEYETQQFEKKKDREY